MRAVTLLLMGCLWMPLAHAYTPADAPEVQQLLRNARYWTEQHRPDLANQSMRKLLTIHPRHPQALLALGQAAPPTQARATTATRVKTTPARKKAGTMARATHGPVSAPLVMAPTAPLVLPATAVECCGVATAPEMPVSMPPEALAPKTPATAASETTAETVETELVAVWQALEQGRAAQGLQLAEEVSSRYPDRPDVTRARALALRDVGAGAQAREGLELAVRQALKAPSSLQWVARESRHALQALDDRRQPSWATGLTLVHKPGDEAVSRLDSRVASLRTRQPWGDHGHWIGQVDRVELDAGHSDTASLAHRGDWGSAAALPPGAPQADAPLRARARGTALTLGYETQRWRADVGTTPLGFEFSGISAGFDLNGRWGASNWDLSLGHRPVTSSLLAHGGQRDVFSGLRWGGVRRTSALVRLSTSWRGMEPFAELETAAYRGHEVLPNGERAAAAGMNWVLKQDPDRYLALAPVLRWRAFDNDQNHYSVGHGGYYSPQRSTTLGVALQTAVRSDELAWTLRFAPSWGRSSTAGSPRFPTRADLQAQAVAQGRGAYGADHGSSMGWALQSTWERRLGPHWSTGMRVSAERSPDYARDQIHIYLRWHEKPQPGPVPLWPSTVTPHAAP